MRSCELVVWIATGRCNLSCRHCYASRFVNFKELSTDEALRMVKGLAEIKAKHLSITGGEPTLRDDLPKIIMEAQDRGLEVSVVTNSLLLKEESMEFLAKRNVEVQVSIDGVTKESFTKIRGPFFDTLLIKIQKLKALGTSLKPIMTINAINYRETGDYVKLCANMETSGAALIPLIPVGRADRELMPDSEMVMESLIMAAQVAEELGFSIELWCSPFARSFLASKLVEVSPCMIALGLDIAPDGSILLCDTLDVKVTSIDVGIPRAWEEYLNSELVKSLSSPSLKVPCKTCKYVEDCLGGCHARAKALYGDLKMPDPLCPIASKARNKVSKLY
ncbi:MAG: radical SAM protein [Candidatus Nezhaarchaeales archaeon]